MIVTPAPPHPLVVKLRARSDEMTDLVTSLACIETPSTVPESQVSALNLLAAELGGRGFRTRHLTSADSGGVLYALPREMPPRQHRQLLLGHVDTVWPLGTLDRMPVERRDGKLYGPGVFDMKAGLVQMLFALDSIEQSPAVAPTVLITTDEELGSVASAPLIRRLARTMDRVLVLEPALGPAGLLKTARKGVGRFVVRIRGRAAHAGLDPERGVSAILELSHVVQGLFKLNDPERGVTVNVGKIDGGMRPNVVAPESRAEVDVRVRTAADADRVTAAIRALSPTVPGTEITVEGGFGRPPMHPSASEALMELARLAAAELGLEIEGAEAGGASDGNLTAAHAPTLDGLGAVGDGAHSEYEYIEIARMPERAALLACLLAAPPLSENRMGPSGAAP